MSGASNAKWPIAFAPSGLFSWRGGGTLRLGELRDYCYDLPDFRSADKKEKRKDLWHKVLYKFRLTEMFSRNSMLSPKFCMVAYVNQRWTRSPARVRSVGSSVTQLPGRPKPF